MVNQQKIDKIFIKIAYIFSKMSNCLNKSVGAILVKNNMIISSGWNGTSKGVLNCNNGGCLRCKNKLKYPSLNDCLCVHAELNCLLQASYNGISTKNSIIYCTLQPCNNCIKNAINAGVLCIYYDIQTNKKINKELLKKIKVIQLK